MLQANVHIVLKDLFFFFFILWHLYLEVESFSCTGEFLYVLQEPQSASQWLFFFKSHQYVKVEISRKLCQNFFSTVLMTQFQLVDHAASLKFHCFHSDWASFQVFVKHMLVFFVAVCMAGKHFLPASVEFSFCWCLRKFNIFISTSFLFKFLMLYPKKPLQSDEYLSQCFLQ